MPEADASQRNESTANSDAASRPSGSMQVSPFATLFAELESIPGLEGLSTWIEGVLAPLTGRRRVMDLLHGRWLGHALHPALSDLPIGMWGSVPLLDLIGDERGATALTAGGCLAAGAAALTGAADWSVTAGRERRLALLHGLANSAVLVIEVGALTARLRGRRRTGQALSLAGIGASAAAAFVGGELVFGRALMVDHTVWTQGPTEWTSVLPGADLADGAMRAVDIEGRQVLLTRLGGVVHAMENTCSHAGGPLAEGTLEDGCVVCPWHGSRFRLADGAVVGGPATFSQPRLLVRENNGQIEIRGRDESA